MKNLIGKTAIAPINMIDIITGEIVRHNIDTGIVIILCQDTGEKFRGSVHADGFEIIDDNQAARLNAVDLDVITEKGSYAMTVYDRGINEERRDLRGLYAAGRDNGNRGILEYLSQRPAMVRLDMIIEVLGSLVMCTVPHDSHGEPVNVKVRHGAAA